MDGDNLDPAPTTAEDLTPSQREARERDLKKARKREKRERKAELRRQRRKRLAVAWIVVGIVAACVYALVIVAYRDSTMGAAPPDLTNYDAIEVYLRPTKLTPADSTVVADVTVDVPKALIGDDTLLNSKIDLLLFNGSGSKVVSFAKGTPSLALATETTVRFKGGAYADYPLDQYATDVGLLAQVQTPTGLVWYPAELGVWGDIAGWQVGSDGGGSAIDAPVPTTAEPTSAVAFAHMGLRRAGSTVSIVVLLLVAMVAVAVLALVIAIAVSRRVRRTEATMAGWFAALLFAVVPLRLNMPGAPPIGAWIDFLVFMWVVLALMFSLVVFVWSWMRFSPAPELHGKEKHKSLLRNGKRRKHHEAGNGEHPDQVERH